MASWSTCLSKFPPGTSSEERKKFSLKVSNTSTLLCDSKLPLGSHLVSEVGSLSLSSLSTAQKKKKIKVNSMVIMMC